jgi:hypothetical protein
MGQLAPVETWAGRWVATGGDTTAGCVVDDEPEEAPEPDDDPDDPVDPDEDPVDPDEDPEDGDEDPAVVVVPWVAAFALWPGSALLK